MSLPELPRRPQIELVSPADLKPAARNARTHSRRQIGQIAASITRFGFTNPVLIDDGKGIIAGHGRVEAAKLLGLHEVPVLRLSHLSPAERRAYVIADNKLAEKAGWDREVLAIELQALIDLNFEVDVTGFEIAEIDLILDGQPAQGTTRDDAVPEVDSTRPAVTSVGDVWIAGAHRLVCGDALKPETHGALLDGEVAAAVFADPPYNVRIAGHVSGLGRSHHREFAMASGEMSEQAFVDFLTGVFRQLATHSADGSIHFICMDWRHVGEALAAGRTAYEELKNICVWNKANGGMGSLYRSKHELVLVFKSGQGRHVNNVELGTHGRYRSNVWDYPGVNSFRPGRDDALAMHPTVKPVALVADAIMDVTRRKDIVLDPFGGSGTTMIAAERAGRRARLIEIDPLHCDTAIQRWQRATKKSALHLGSGRTFDDLAAEAAARATAGMATESSPLPIMRGTT